MEGSQTIRLARDSFAKLHKGLGVWHASLPKRMGPELRELWHASRSEPVDLVHAKAIFRIEEVLTQLPKDTATKARIAYNLVKDPTVINLDFTERCTALSPTFGAGYSKRSIERVLSDSILPRFNEYLHSRLRPADTRELTAILDVWQPIRARAARSTALGEDFLTRDVFAVRPERPGLLSVRTSDGTRWTRAFYTIDRLVAYQRETSPSWSGAWMQLSGADLVQEMRSLGLVMGILLDAGSGTELDAGDLRSFTADQVAEMYSHLRA